MIHIQTEFDWKRQNIFNARLSIWAVEQISFE